MTTTETSTHTTTTTLTASSTSPSPPATSKPANTSSPPSTTANGLITQNTPKPPQQQEEEPDIYDEIEIEDMTFDATLQIYHYPCPCGDRFEIAIDDLRDGQDIAVCPGCSLMIRVIYEVEDLPEKT